VVVLVLDVVRVWGVYSDNIDCMRNVHSFKGINSFQRQHGDGNNDFEKEDNEIDDDDNKDVSSFKLVV